MKIEELLGTLQQAVVDSWKKHIETSKYSEHKPLNEFYDDMLEHVDALIEAYMGVHGKVKGLKSILDDKYPDAVSYLEALKKVAEDGKELLDKDELKSDLDTVLSDIDAALYKIKELKESKTHSMRDYIANHLVVEGIKGHEDE